MLSFLRPLAAPACTLALTLAAACGGGGGGDTPVSPPPTQPPPAGRPTLAPTYRPTGRAAAGDVMVHLFEWPWASIATECEAVLGPAGYKAVQVSPPQEHALVASANFPWWQRYQPVSYSIARSRSGTAAEFQAMVTRCRAAGVDIYVDAVINHMTAGSGTGSNGTQYTKYNYPGTWTQADFHQPACGVNNYQDAANVQDCELVGLADLNTGSAAVRQRLADYLVALARLGVAGFRIDAAKHIQPVELDGVINAVNTTLAAEGRPRPYVFAEVIDYGGEAVKASDYYGLGYASGGAADVTEFKVRGLSDKFANLGGQRVSDLKTFSQANWGIMPSDKAVVFLENHDTARDRGFIDLSYRTPTAWRLGMVFLLGQPYGYPSVLSGYSFDRATGFDQGPPGGSADVTPAVTCAASLEAVTGSGQWTCEHRDPVVRRMVAFRRAVAGADVTMRWDDGQNGLAFSRADRGFVAINRNAAAVRVQTATGLAAGAYCDVLAGGRAAAGGCAGTRVDVAAGGLVDVTVPAGSALVLQAGVAP